MPWLNKRWISFFVSSTVAAVVLICVVGWANNRKSNQQQNRVDSYGTDPIANYYPWSNWTDTNADEVLVNIVTVNSFDPNGKTGPALAVQLSYTILNVTSGENQTSSSVPIQIILPQKTVNIAANAALPDQTLSLDAFNGNPNNYPFDSYDVSFFISASTLPTNDSDDIPFTMFTLGAVQGFTYTTQFQGDDDGSTVSINFHIRRSTTTQLFAVIIFLLMWFLSLSIFIAAMSVWFRGKNAELPLISISTALLFALPNIRNSQPGVPSPIGTTEDMVGFFWNILLVAISGIFLLIKWVIQNKRPPPTPTDPENVEKPLKSGQ